MINGHGDDVYQYNREIISNFSSNVYNQTDLSGLEHYLSANINVINAYPHPEAASLRTEIAKKDKVSSTNICLTNGSVEAIYLIAQLFWGKRSGIVIPTFSEYEDACTIHRHLITYLDRLSDPDRFDLVWLCNPNNPTGYVYDKQFLVDIISRYPEVMFIMDQAYESFTLKQILSSEEVIDLPNVILLRSLTKKYAIPGLRLGYITAQENIIESIRNRRIPWSVNSLAIAAGHYLINHECPMDLFAYLNEKTRLSRLLGNINGLEIFPSDVHFMLIRLLRGKSAELKDYLALEHGMLIRDAANFRGLNDSYVRIATQLPVENDMLFHAIQAWFKTF